VDIVVGDIGGTHARFGLATIDDGAVTALDRIVTLHTGNYTTLEGAWDAYAAHLDHAPPLVLAMAVACPVTGEVLKLTNHSWIIDPSRIGERLGVDAFLLINDFEANGYAVSEIAQSDRRHICGPEGWLPDVGVISVVGPGTGLGVASVVCSPAGVYVAPSEGGHLEYAPTDAVESAILDYARRFYPRVSVERLVSGPGLLHIYQALAEMEGRAPTVGDDKQLWRTALDGSDTHAAAALDRFCKMLGSVTGDIALVQGASAVAMVGNLANRLADRLAGPGFPERFTSKGRLTPVMERIPVTLVTHAQLGLLGAASAFAKRARS
jgi:glucokinase